MTLFTKGGGQWLEAMAETGCDALGLDWTTDIADARRRVGNKVALQGNMDPSMLYASARVLKKKWRPFLPALARGKATSLTLDTVFIRTLTPSMRASLLRLCTVCPHPITSRR
ncbi:Uroporphyrinogen III decarboxylase [Klebsiella pneumoniae]|uniref:Uroporphyrinogen III decarboxylase n=1 Tax=Klebsiella pneumoniae TaxID=573 RepID=A0A377XKB3_KLEPN|nr:Uroporphyrinogen III decarboxylase [Klebsiella pneumoniae]